MGGEEPVLELNLFSICRYGESDLNQIICRVIFTGHAVQMNGYEMY